MLKQLEKINESVNAIANEYGQQYDANVKLKQVEPLVKIMYNHFRQTFCKNRKQ